MAFEDEAPLERAYPYHASWKSFACASLFTTVVGVLGAALVPFGCGLVGNGWPCVGFGVAVAGVVMLRAPLLMLAVGLKEAIRPPLLRVTPTALHLPDTLRGLDNSGDQKKEPPKPPQQPEEIPFSAIRWVRRQRGAAPGGDALQIVHDLSQSTLVVEQYMMRAADFDELETVLRAAIPAAFTSHPAGLGGASGSASQPGQAPPTPPSPPQADGV